MLHVGSNHWIIIEHNELLINTDKPTKFFEQLGLCDYIN